MAAVADPVARNIMFFNKFEEFIFLKTYAKSTDFSVLAHHRARCEHVGSPVFASRLLTTGLFALCLRDALAQGLCRRLFLQGNNTVIVAQQQVSTSVKLNRRQTPKKFAQAVRLVPLDLQVVVAANEFFQAECSGHGPNFPILKRDQGLKSIKMREKHQTKFPEAQRDGFNWASGCGARVHAWWCCGFAAGLMILP